MTEMPPSRPVGPMNAILRTWWNQGDERWREAVRASTLLHRTPPPPPYYRALLSLAQDLLTGGQYELRHELAIVVAQMACEVVVEQTLTPLLPKNKKPPKNFNLEGGKGAALETYTRLTHDQITKEPFWKPFVHHANLRHKIVHAGKRVGQADAEKSLRVATQFVDHVEIRATLR
jgi:hypothetical protein